jgi:hypothetical protein
MGRGQGVGKDRMSSAKYREACRLIEDGLSEHPNIPLHRDGHSITILAQEPDGYDVPSKVVVERMEGDRYVRIGLLGTLVWPFARRTKAILQNRILPRSGSSEIR